MTANTAAQAAATPVGAADIAYPGGVCRYVTPNKITEWRVETFHSKERDTLAWIETFQPEDVLVDIGANVGMYTVWAAKTRGCRVIAFEPESQNYALLNMNLYLNGLSEQVSAYCMAIAEASGFDHFYLGRFEPGGSCHAFGAPVNPDLKPYQPEFRQGCFAAPLDELIEAGVTPPPTHVKIDVDGLEHAVVAGMAQTLASPTLKSVLIEINGKLAEHQQIVEMLQTNGFHVDNRQRDASLQKEGFFAGSGNIIFWKEQAAAEALGLRLSGAAPTGAPRVAGLTAAEAFEAAEAAIAAAPVSLDPTPHWYCDQVFPPAFYEELQNRMPPPEAFTSITDIGWVKGEGPESQRGVLPFDDMSIAKLPPELAGFWRDVAACFRTERFALTMLRKFLPQMADRFGADVGRMRFSASSMLISDEGEYALGPHTDRPSRVLASLFYLPTDGSQVELGTSLYLPKQPGLTCPGGPHHRFEDFQNVATMPFLPNTAFCFFKTDTCFHGVEPIPADAKRRNMFSYILETAD